MRQLPVSTLYGCVGFLLIRTLFRFVALESEAKKYDIKSEIPINLQVPIETKPLPALRPPLPLIHTMHSDFDVDLIRGTSASSLHSAEMMKKNCTFVVNGKEDRPHWSFSFLAMLRHHESSICNYHIEYFRFQNRPDKLEKYSERFRRTGSPCILVSTKQKFEVGTREKYAPHCHLMITNDEFCAKDTDIRLYYNEKSPSQLYLPLGPRGDFREAYQKLKALFLKEHGSRFGTIVKTSERAYVFNAIFSRSTSKSRTPLHHMLNTSSIIKEHPEDYFIHITDKWSRKSEEHINSTIYTDILGKSQFTIAPAGHNPECYRLYEAILMGSIPIVVLDDEYRNHHCPNALKPFLSPSSPLIVLQSWNELETTLTSLHKEGPQALNRRQAAMRRWYKSFFSERFTALDKYLERFPYPITWKP